MKKAGKKTVEFQPFWSYESSPSGKRFSVFWRLFELEKGPSGISMRLFFSPKIRFGSKSSETTK